MTKKKSLGLYIHVPFCRQKCNYCDFCSVAGADGELVSAYVSSLLASISQGAEKCRGHVVDTIYVGGGTPTLLDPRSLGSIIERCAKDYSIADGAEISCECNPATVTSDGLAFMRSSGINRLSIGLQSIHENELRALGRLHSFGDFLETFSAARRVGFDNVSADLMYGLPEQTEESFERTLRTLCELAPEHISAYCLKVEENTPFGRLRDKLILPDEDAQYAMYMLCGEILGCAGYEKYEISNFAKEGRESRHNLRYWLGEDYLGFGASAHSYFGGERFSQSANIATFARGEFYERDREKIDDEEKLREYVMLRMRLARGVSLSEFSSLFGREFTEELPVVKRFADSGHLLLDGETCRFSDDGFFVSSYILSEMLDFA